MVHQTRIMQNGSGWYWEVVNQDRAVIARGIADTQAQARVDAESASHHETPIHESTPRRLEAGLSQATRQVHPLDRGSATSLVRTLLPSRH